jgi:FlaA1/EpsC-like NDP-sugar epimerase
LLTAEEGLTKTVYEKIFVGQPQPLEVATLTASLQKLFRSAEHDDEPGIREALHNLVGGALVAEKTM